jgi:hypothetical protein
MTTTLTGYVGGTVVPSITVRGEAGTVLDPTTVTAVVTDPAGTPTTWTYAGAQHETDGSWPAAAVARTGTGKYALLLPLTLAGRWVVAWATTGPVTATAQPVQASAVYAALPTLADVSAYLGDHSASDADVQAALDAETAAQAARCRIPANYPDDLAEALKRRVARNLALKLLPLAVLQGDTETGSTVLPGNDPEVRRLEAPHRKLVVG